MEANMSQIPASPSLEFLRKEAKQLLRSARAGDERAIARFTLSLPALQRVPATSVRGDALRLHDAQSVVAREHGFRSWTELKRTVEWMQWDHAERIASWLRWVYDGAPRERRIAAQVVSKDDVQFKTDIWVVCATGNAEVLQKALANDPTFATTARNPMGMPPLIAITHSWLLADERFAPGLLQSARLLLACGADPDSHWINPTHPEWPLSAMYGAAGKLHHPDMVRLLLAAGATADDNESLYHSVETRESTITKILLDAGASVKGTNAIARAIDYGKAKDIAAMLAHGGDVREGLPVHHAILRGCPMNIIQLLVDTGADLRAVNREGVNLYCYAVLFGREDAAALLRSRGIEEPLSKEDSFIAACACADAKAVSAILSDTPDMIERLDEKALRIMPQLAAIGRKDAVRTMLEAGWPREVKFGWAATALNHAIYRGDAAMAALLLDYGADWRTKHGFEDNALGTLSWSSQNEPEDPTAPCDFLGCARTLVEHSVPLPDETYRFSPEVEAYFDSLRLFVTPP
jgi:ankyrin repeat protein